MFKGLDRFYTTFVQRDVKYMLTGGIPLAFLVYVHRNLFGGAMSHTLLFLLGFASVSYALGFALFHAAMTVPWRNRPLIRIYPPLKKCRPRVGSFETQESKMIRALRKRRGDIYLQRVLFLKEMNGCVVVISTCLIVLLAIYPDLEAPAESGWEDWWKRLAGCAVAWPPAWVAGVLLLLGLAITGSIQNRSKAMIQWRAVFRRPGKLQGISRRGCLVRTIRLQWRLGRRLARPFAERGRARRARVNDE